MTFKVGQLVRSKLGRHKRCAILTEFSTTKCTNEAIVYIFFIYFEKYRAGVNRSSYLFLDEFERNYEVVE